MEIEDIISNIVKNNDPKYNYSKLCEELFELGEVCSKMMNKKPEQQPPIEKLIEEAGDVLVRIAVLAYAENIVEEINERFNEKLQQIQNSIDKQQYKGGV